LRFAQPALKQGEAKSIVKGQRLLCMAEYEYEMHLSLKEKDK